MILTTIIYRYNINNCLEWIRSLNMNILACILLDMRLKLNQNFSVFATVVIVVCYCCFLLLLLFWWSPFNLDEVFTYIHIWL